MKKIIAAIILAIFISPIVKAQVDANTIGLRFGGGDNSGAEISFQHGFNDVNRLELDLGFGYSKGYDQFKISGIYQWVFNIEDGLGWYIGPGASLGLYSYNEGYYGNNGYNSDFYIEAMGQIGLQYRFDFPLQLTLDFRPAVEIIPELGHLHGSFGFGIRYVLGGNK